MCVSEWEPPSLLGVPWLNLEVERPVKKVLIIAHSVSPSRGVGALRIQGLMKYLSEFEWEPIILTAFRNGNDSGCRVFETRYDDLFVKWKHRAGLNTSASALKQMGVTGVRGEYSPMKMVVKVWQEIFAYPDPEVGWLRHAANEGVQLSKNTEPDAIVSSGQPFTSHLIARRIQDETNLPWIADYRDLWTQGSYYRYSRVRRLMDRKMEISTVSTANALTTVSPILADELRKIHEVPVYSIPNGYDPDEVNRGSPLPSKLTITHAGSLYQGRRDPGLFFRALRELADENLLRLDDLSIEFYGEDEDWLRDCVTRYDLMDFVTIKSRLPRDEIIEVQKRSHLLLLVLGSDTGEAGICTGKVFEYLAARRPILSIGCKGSLVEKLLRETMAGHHVSDLESAKKTIQSFFSEFSESGSVQFHGISARIDRYSHREMARRFSNLLNQVTRN